MNTILRRLFKALFIFVQPVIAVWLFFAVCFGWPVGLPLVLVILLNFSSAIVLYVLLDNITILPNVVKVQKIPQIGLSVGLTDKGFAILIPFIYIEICYKKTSVSN